MTKTIFTLSAVMLLSGCVAQNQISNEGKTLHGQAPGAPAHSALNAPSIISPAHSRYKSQINPVNSAFRGAVVGGTIGNIIEEDTEGTAYGVAAGGLLGYGSAIYR